jgi:hypothetical protein
VESRGFLFVGGWPSPTGTGWEGHPIVPQRQIGLAALGSANEGFAGSCALGTWSYRPLPLAGGPRGGGWGACSSPTLLAAAEAAPRPETAPTPKDMVVVTGHETPPRLSCFAPAPSSIHSSVLDFRPLFLYSNVIWVLPAVYFSLLTGFFWVDSVL